MCLTWVHVPCTNTNLYLRGFASPTNMCLWYRLSSASIDPRKHLLYGLAYNKCPAPSTSSEVVHRSRLLSVLLTNWLYFRDPQDTLLEFDSFAKVTQKIQGTCKPFGVPNYVLFLKEYQWNRMHRARWSVEVKLAYHFWFVPHSSANAFFLGLYREFITRLDWLTWLIRSLVMKMRSLSGKMEVLFFNHVICNQSLLQSSH